MFFCLPYGASTYAAKLFIEDQMSVSPQQLAQMVEAGSAGPRPQFGHMQSGPQGAVATARFSPTPSLNPGNVEAIDGWNIEELRGHLQSVHTAFDTAYKGLVEIDKARQAAAKNSAWNPHQALLNVSLFAEKTQGAITRAFDSAHKYMTKAAEALDQQLSQAMSANVAGPLAAEIRQYVRALTSDEKMKFINTAMKERDVTSLAAVLGTKAYLSGISPEMQRGWTRTYNELAYPEASRKLDVTRKAIALLEERGPLVFDQVTQAMGGYSWDTVRKIRQASSEAEKALLFNEGGA